MTAISVNTLLLALNTSIRAKSSAGQYSLRTINQNCRDFIGAYTEMVGENAEKAPELLPLWKLYDNWNKEISPALTGKSEGLPGKIHDLDAQVRESLNMLKTIPAGADVQAAVSTRLARLIGSLKETQDVIFALLYISEKSEASGKLVDWKKDVENAEKQVREAIQSKPALLFPDMGRSNFRLVPNPAFGRKGEPPFIMAPANPSEYKKKEEDLRKTVNEALYRKALEAIVQASDVQNLLKDFTDFAIWFQTFSSSVSNTVNEFRKTQVSTTHIELMLGSMIAESDWEVVFHFCSVLEASAV